MRLPPEEPGPSKRRALLGCLLVVLAACEGSNLLRPPPSLERRVFLPSLVYVAWWNEIADCAQVEGDISRVRFFQVIAPLSLRGRQFPCGEGATCNGMWERPHDISIASAMLMEQRLVKHEMLHDLLDAVDHPAVFETCDVEWGVSTSVRDVLP